MASETPRLVGRRDRRRGGEPPGNPPREKNNNQGRRGGPSTARSNAGGGSQAIGTQARIERDGMARLADLIKEAEPLEELATQVRDFFQGSKSPESGAARGKHRWRAGRREDRERGVAQGESVAQGEVDETQPRPNNWQTDTREATRLQKLFRANKAKAVREVLSGSSPYCKIPREVIHDHFSNIYSPRDSEVPGPPDALDFENEPSECSSESLVAALDSRAVSRRLEAMQKSSPGPDGVTYGDLRKADPGAELLTALFNAVLRVERVPAVWKESNTVLIHKKGCVEDISNWRPLAMGDTVPKLFAAVLADRLTDWAVGNQRLSPCQKGFLPHEGCYEHNFLLQETLDDAKLRRRPIFVAWLDLSNAFGSVPHSTIMSCLRLAGVPEKIANIARSLYTDCGTRVRTEEGFTENIPMRAGVRQGCPLSPVLFNLALEPIFHRLNGLNAGYELHGRKIATLAYADDIALIASSPEEMTAMLETANEMATALGLAFNPAKCATLAVGRRGKVDPDCAPFTLRGEQIAALQQGEGYKHLGIPTGVGVRQTPYDSIEALTTDLAKIDESLLAPWQKVDALAVFVLPRMDFILRGADVRKGPLTEADKAVRKVAKSWLNLPARASAEPVYLPPSRGGCGLLPLADMADILTVAHAFRMLTASDPAVAEVALASLTGAVRARIRREPSREELALFLSGNMEGDFGKGSPRGASTWSRARAACMRLPPSMRVEWRHDQVESSFALKCAASNRAGAVIVPASARTQVIRALRHALTEHYAGTLLSKRDQGKVYEVTARDPVSNHFMRSGSFMRFADWRFLHRARLDVLPLNGAIRWAANDKRCRVCGDANETLPHVLGHCNLHSALRQKRHNAIQDRLARAIKLPGDVSVNSTVPLAEGQNTGLRPDIVVTNEQAKRIHIIDVAVPFENRFAAIPAAREEKLSKYASLADDLRRKGYEVIVDAFIVGALGGWDPVNDQVLSMLRVNSYYARLMRRLMVSETIAWSRNIYVQHVTGEQQTYVPQSYMGTARTPTEEATNTSDRIALSGTGSGSQPRASRNST